MVLAAGVASATLSQSFADSWHEAAPMESARAQVRAAVVGGEIYVAGGSTLKGQSDVFEVYDPVSDHWHALQSMPDGREQFGMAAIDSLVYIAGGLSSWNKGQPTSSVYSFDTATGVWQRRADLPDTRAGLTLSAVGRALFAVGGRGADAGRVYRYDPQADKWTAVGSGMPDPRTGHAVAVGGTKIYVVGGRSLEGHPLARVDVFDTETNKWSTGAALPSSVVAATADFIGDKLHVAGGTSPEARRTLTSHWLLQAGKWTAVKPMPTARQALTSASVGDRWYLIGGGSGDGVLAVFTESDSVEVYTP
jgi:N-acetylneuraminic acid mutarotase